MTAEELMKRYNMQAHVENGSYIERHYEHKGEGRADSGSIYYYVAPGEYTEFHRIDCDEYWCYICGSPLELWMIDEDGELTVSILGTNENAEPLVFFKKGVIFASRSFATTEGTFLSCITVARFSADGFELIGKEQMENKYPETKKFYTMEKYL